MRVFLIALAACSGGAKTVTETSRDAAQQTGPLVVTSNAPIFCWSDAKQTMIGECRSNESDCEADRRQQTDATTEPCTQRVAAACFDFEIVITGGRDFTCAPSLEWCGELRTHFATRKDFAVRGDCYAYRYKR